MIRTVNLKEPVVIEGKRRMPDYVSYGRGLCRATGGMAHEVVARQDSRGRIYAEDTVTGKRVMFEKSIIQRTRDHEEKVLRRVSNLCHKAETIGLTAKEFESLSYYAKEEVIQADWNVQKRVLRTLTGQHYDAGKICSRGGY